jgi:hypothetical protein
MTGTSGCTTSRSPLQVGAAASTLPVCGPAGVHCCSGTVVGCWHAPVWLDASAPRLSATSMEVGEPLGVEVSNSRSALPEGYTVPSWVAACLLAGGPAAHLHNSSPASAPAPAALRSSTERLVCLCCSGSGG